MPLTPLKKQNSFFTRLKGYFISGILVSTPILLTIYLVHWLINTVDNAVRPLVPEHITVAYGYFPGYGLLATIIVVTLFGAFVRGFLGRYLVRIGESMVERMPIIRSIYTTIKQIAQALLDKESSSFREVGLVEYPRQGIWTICFITGKTLGEVQEKTKHEILNVFIPTTPNPTSGFLLFVPKKDVKILDMTVDEGIKMAVSAGVITPKVKEGGSIQIPKQPATKKSAGTKGVKKKK